MLELDPYQKNLAGLVLVCGTLLATGGSGPESRPRASGSRTQDAKTRQYESAHRGTQWAFYVGPYLYSLYRDEHNIPQRLIAPLFTTGFLSGAFSATFIGSLADRFGRRLACLSFCLIYSLSCVLTVIPSLPSLFAGRVLGGVGTSLLFSVFETWMVADFGARYLGRKGLDLGRTFGTMSTVNSVVAIGSGVLSEWMVERTGTRKTPFGACVAVLGLAAAFIYTQWDENYGEVAATDKSNSPENKLLKALANKKVLSLGLASTMFEGSMYLFVFSWAPALEAAHDPAAGPLPYGTIFASFMAAMMASSLLFTRLAPAGHGTVLSGLLVASAGVFYALSRSGSAPGSEQATFWLFCAFEACVGVYWPCVGVLRGKAVDDAVRAQVYGIMRIPLNVFVVVSLLKTGGSGGEQYAGVFGTCAGLLLVAALGLVATTGTED
ncbi:related to major facilitator superfamily domain-containing protein 5 [Cephalotrichum gorgonifer]|uniref:Molybdate-anion transporter n=1 Tax=Cephalotrichum gorgonifer TaxID=2041049 RepID=A0AAE8N0B2_9PEZI|nr:related to major facilitator superfamily domain-containing protein 5 [Cephalotrichum gorgonifer]